jgi:hypothetical protein
VAKVHLPSSFILLSMRANGAFVMVTVTLYSPIDQEFLRQEHLIQFATK